MRVLVATDGTWGDVGPLAAVASELRTRGHAVRLLLNPSYADDVERQGLEVERVGVPWEDQLEGLDPADFMKPISGTLLVLQKFLVPEIAQWAAATARTVDDFRPDAALVHHLAWGPLRALSEREVPVAAALLAPTVLMSADDPGRPAGSLPPPPRWLVRTSRPVLRAIFRRLLDRRAAPEFGAAGYSPPRDLYFYAHEVARLTLGLWSRRLRSGRPAVIVPFGHDQIDNAFRASSLGVARVVPRKRETVDRLARSLELVLGDERVLAAAREVGEFVGREQGASVAADQLERLAPPGPRGGSDRRSRSTT